MVKKIKKISIIGSTGSIGRQAVEVILNNRDKLQAIALVSNENEELLIKQGEQLGAKYLGLFSKRSKNKEILFGEDCYKLASLNDADIVLIASGGISALPYVIESVKAGKTIALANKESIVCGGKIIMPMLKEYGAKIIPVDSEHSAIWQSLKVGRKKDVRKLILTASGGPFFGMSKKQLENVTVLDALRHPTWNMGKKITIDSATMMNKGLEIIEAVRLFNIGEDKIDVVIHRESIIHSMVEFTDGAVIGEMSKPTMEIPISLSLFYPKRERCAVDKLDFTKLTKMTFYPLDNENFPFVNLAREVIRKDGLYPTVFNSANEIAVSRFINGEIGFLDIFKVVKETLFEVDCNLPLTIENIYKIDKIAREVAKNINLEK